MSAQFYTYTIVVLNVHHGLSYPAPTQGCGLALSWEFGYSPGLDTMGKAYETQSCNPFLGRMGSLGISRFQCWKHDCLICVVLFSQYLNLSYLAPLS